MYEEAAVTKTGVNPPAEGTMSRFFQVYVSMVFIKGAVNVLFIFQQMTAPPRHLTLLYFTYSLGNSVGYSL